MNTIRHLIFLIHPCCYEGIDAAGIRADNLGLFVERERMVRQRWLEELGQRSDDTLLVQLYGPETLHAAAVERLGEGRAVRLRADFPGDRQMREYYRRLLAVLDAHLRRHDLAFDPATVTSELWGESFEGCAPGYGGAFAEHLGLRLAPKMRFDMTVFDARFLHGATNHEVIAIPDTDVEAWLFQCHDTTSAATFQPRLSAQWLDRRRVALMLDERRLQVCTKQGHTIWPAEPWTKGKPPQVSAFAMALSDFNSHWIRAVGMAYDAFRDVVGAARILDPEEAPTGP